MSPKAQQCVSSFWAADHVALTPASVLAPSPLLWQNIRPTGNSRKKECILVDGSRRVQGLDGEGGGEAGNWEATLSITQRKQSKGDQLARPPFKFHNVPQTTWKPSVEIPAPLGDTARSKHCRTLLFPWVQLVDFILYVSSLRALTHRICTIGGRK